MVVGGDRERPAAGDAKVLLEQPRGGNRGEVGIESLIDDAVEPLAIGGASVLSSTTRAHGFVVIDADSEGFAADSPVHVYLYDSWGCV